MKLLYPWRHRKGFKLGTSIGSKSQNASAQRGIAYHRRVFRALEQLYANEATLHIEPWFQQVCGSLKPPMLSPDAVLDFGDGTALVIEVKLNWADGRDEKLINRYLPVVKSAFDLEVVWPLLITSCVRGAKHPPLLGLQQLEQCIGWEPGQPTPLLLMP